MALTMVSVGEEVILRQIRGGYGLRKRLADLGLNPGVKMKVINNRTPGPFIISVRDSRLILGHGLAHHILVEACN